MGGRTTDTGSRSRGATAGIQAVYERAPDRSQPLLAYPSTLEGRRQPVIKNQIERLNMLHLGEHLPIVYSKPVEGELRELRCHYGNELYRICSRQSRRLFILLHIIRSAARS